MIKIETIVSKFTSNCYIIQINNKTFIIDPSVNVEIIKKYLFNKKIDGILITHCHMDHIYMLDECLKEFNTICYMSKYGKDLLFNNDNNYGFSLGIKKEFLIDSKKIQIISDSDMIENIIKVIYTKGHTKDSVCYLVENKLFTGDTLFNGNVGRTDLYSGNTLDLINSIKKIYCLDNTIEFYPGHENNSTLEYQFLNNEFVRKIMFKKAKK